MPLFKIIAGSIPSWVSGSLYRNGSGLFHVGSDQYKHLFDGLAVVHKFTIHSGRVTYQNKLLESETLKRNMAAQKIVVGEVGTMGDVDPYKNVFSR